MNKFTHDIDFGFDGEALIIRTYDAKHDFCSSFIPSPGTTIEQLIVQIKAVEKIMTAAIENGAQNAVL